MGEALELAIGKREKSDCPPPGPGLATVTWTVRAAVRSAAGTIAERLAPLTKEVGNGLPFQFTVLPAEKLAPLTARVRDDVPGAELAGVSARLRKGMPPPLRAPDPVNVMLCGLSASSSKILSVPFLVPRSEGVKSTVMLQLWPGARLLPHGFEETRKSDVGS